VLPPETYLPLIIFQTALAIPFILNPLCLKKSLSSLVIRARIRCLGSSSIGIISLFSSEKNSVISFPFISTICEGRAGRYSPILFAVDTFFDEANIMPNAIPNKTAIVVEKKRNIFNRIFCFPVKIIFKSMVLVELLSIQKRPFLLGMAGLNIAPNIVNWEGNYIITTFNYNIGFMAKSITLFYESLEKQRKRADFPEKPRIFKQISGKRRKKKKSKFSYINIQKKFNYILFAFFQFDFSAYAVFAKSKDKSMLSCRKI